MDVEIDLLNIMTTSIPGVDQRLADLNIIMIMRAQTLAATANIECACVPVVDKLKQIPEVLSTIIEDLKMNNPVVNEKIKEEWNKCCSPKREDFLGDNEVEREEKEDYSKNLNIGKKYDDIGSSENNMSDVKVEVPEEPNVPDMQVINGP
ncbi:hypothetical protein NDU88_003617 [Pleurodeles waltl]|uniref:Uncharacterized protein n=1 Tax=Pleurodeles waltl TaxID=8319 RepID=A0AAV7WT90_PLEWA|nr:hypothetical protein NDU88_003617 [Pleurodeles waltl]